MIRETKSNSIFTLIKITISILLTFGVVVAVLAQMHGGGHGAPPPPKIAMPESGITLPMQDFGGRPVVEITINGKGPYRFILDTGASITVLSNELNRELALPAPAGMTAKAEGGDSAPAIVMIPNLRIGEAALQDMMAAVMPLGNLLKGDNAPVGVLNAASFPGYLVTFDYPRKLISIKKGELDAADSNTIFQYSADAVLPTVPVRVAGHEITLEVDTGTAFGVTLPRKFLTEIPLAGPAKESKKVRTPGGEFTVSIAKVNGTIEIGKHGIDLDEVQFSDVKAGTGAPIGNIGYGLLRKYVMTLDSKNRRVRIENPQN